MISAISFPSSKKLKKLVKKIPLSVMILSVLVVITVSSYLFYTVSFVDKIFPNTYIAGVYVGGMRPSKALEVLSGATAVPEKIYLSGSNKSFEIDTADFLLSYDYEGAINRAYSLPRNGNFILDTLKRIELIFKPTNLGLIVNLDETRLASIFSVVSKEISVPPINPYIEIVDDLIKVNKGSAGAVVDSKQLRQLVGTKLAYNLPEDVNLPSLTIDPTLTDDEINLAKIRAEKYLDKTLLLKQGLFSYPLTDTQIVKYLNPLDGYNNSEIDSLVYKIAAEINKDPQNPKFEFNGVRVTEFAPAEDGIKLNNEAFKDEVILNLDKLADTTEAQIEINIPVIITKPLIATEEVNDLGIKELIGRGTSTYFHSIPGRVFNVNLAASRINGTLVKPGETFSFNQVLGDVSKFTGYKEAYIISGGKTILGDGGGVCQVSTTLFRAALNSGLPINDRTAHAYRVGYYEQGSPPGIDATVYSPRPDFKFTNDTEHHILIQAKNDPKNYSLVFELYGTRDGRIAKVSKPVVSNYSPPLPTVYQDDPTLPAGTTKQIDYAAAGARVTFNYSVTKDGQETFKRTFVSNYQPWAAVYLRGTKN